MNIFFTSDTHFDHINMCRATSKWTHSLDQTRDFDSLQSMNQALLNGINSVVGANDILFHLGDFAFQGVDNYKVFREQINCKTVHLIYGNHDNKHGHTYDPKMSDGKHVSSLFESYSQYKELFLYESNFVLFHYPIASWNHMSNGGIHLFGHCHSKPEAKFFNGGKSFDVGVDGNNLRPYELSEIFEITATLPVKTEGHH